jgi:hypothetical protein
MLLTQYLLLSRANGRGPSAACVLFVAALCTLFSTPAKASAVTSSGGELIAGRQGAHHREWLKVTAKTDARGRVQLSTNVAYVELATGLNYWENGQWLETKEEFELVPGWAVARRGPHKFALAYNLNTLGAVTITLPDGHVMRAQPLGLHYLDPGTGQSVMLGQIKDCAGRLVSTNQVLYEDAFTELRADIRYTYTKAGVEQDVILREQLPDPALIGMRPETTRLAVMSEFIDAPVAKVTQGSDVTGLRTGAAVPNDQVELGLMHLGEGKAFELNLEGGAKPVEEPIPVGKRWMTIEGRTFLLEQVPIPELKSVVDKLPKHGGVRPRSGARMLANVELPAVRNEQPGDQPLELAGIESPAPGVVIDYVLINTGQTNFTFQSGETYYISGSAGFYGTTVLEGGTVIKYSSGQSVGIHGPLDCQTTVEHPAVLTAKDDDSVGEVISGSTGDPSGYYANNALWLYSGANPVTLHDLRISYAQTGFYGSTSSNSVRNVLFQQVGSPFNCASGTWWLENILACQVANALVQGYSVNYRGTFVTLDQAGKTVGSGYGLNLYLTNSLLVRITNSSTYYGANNATDATGLGVFQSAGAAAHYLAGSSYRNQGTTNIHPNLLAQIKTMTTYAPQDGGNADTNTPDLGYHYSVNEDSDYDQLSDAWEWHWFGSYGHTGSELDNGGINTLLYDYTNDLAPDVFSFSGIEVTNNYVRTNLTVVQLEVTGYPYYIAVLLDDTNFTDSAVWNAYGSSNVTINLGTNQGWHEVRIGLRGHADATNTAIWQWKRLKLDTLPPTLVVTNPTNNTVTTPLLQLMGFSLEDLGQISCALSNAVGFASDEPILVGRRHFDTRAREFTTNYFQGYDLELTNGLNAIKVCATDLAGNVSTNNFTFTLDYSGKTNPPSVQITWPKDGTKVTGSSFTLDGVVEDPAAAITAEIVATNGAVNTANGLVERNGRFWVDNLPLGGGTNVLTLTVKDSAGNTSVTNLNIIKGILVLTMDPVVPDSDLWKPKLDLTGVISDASYAVWVNGVKGHNNGDGTWSAADVPTTSGGVASFTVVAYEPTDQQPDGSYGNP